MIRRISTLLLVLLILVNQGLGLAHVHLGGDLAEAAKHDARPHLHVGGHTHHHGHPGHPHATHSHRAAGAAAPNATLAAAGPTGAEHDSDAIYVGSSVAISLTGRSADDPSERDGAGTAAPQVGIRSEWLPARGPSAGPSPVVAEVCPIYLRTLSLRL